MGGNAAEPKRRIRNARSSRTMDEAAGGTREAATASSARTDPPPRAGAGPGGPHGRSCAPGRGVAGPPAPQRAGKQDTPLRDAPEDGGNKVWSLKERPNLWGIIESRAFSSDGCAARPVFNPTSVPLSRPLRGHVTEEASAAEPDPPPFPSPTGSVTGVCEDVEPDVLVQGRATSFRGWVLLNEAVISWWGFPAATPGRGKPGVGAPPRPPRLMSPGSSKAGGHAFGAMVRRASVFPEHGFRCELTSGHQGLSCRIGFPREGALEIL